MFYIRKPVQKCQHFIYVCKTNVKCVQNSYQSFSDNDIDYKPSMKNVQFSCYSIFHKNDICTKVAF